MNSTSKNATEQASSLSAIEKIELIDILWAKEAEDRLAAYRTGDIKVLNFNQVLAKYS